VYSGVFCVVKDNYFFSTRVIVSLFYLYGFTVTIWLLIILISLDVLFILKIMIMLKNISNLGSSLSTQEQRLIQGGSPVLCSVCLDYCRSQNFQSKEEFSACFNECRQELC